MKATLFILAAFVLYTFAKKAGDKCMTALDCDDGCCLMMMNGEMKCHMKAMKGEKCDHTGMTMDACMCQGDMMCMTDSTMDMDHGICMDKMTA